jgi:hypothetical protein
MGDVFFLTQIQDEKGVKTKEFFSLVKAFSRIRDWRRKNARVFLRLWINKDEELEGIFYSQPRYRDRDYSTPG